MMDFLCQKKGVGVAVSGSMAGFMHKSGHFSVTKIIFNIAEKITIHLCILPFDNFGKEEKTACNL